MSIRERHILERAVQAVTEQAAKADGLVDEAAAAGGGSHSVTVHDPAIREYLKSFRELD